MWFGDERGYNATAAYINTLKRRCGLVMKEDITQLKVHPHFAPRRCGLVMKEDITQHATEAWSRTSCCGLVMKEDITQLRTAHTPVVHVVVW